MYAIAVTDIFKRNRYNFKGGGWEATLSKLILPPSRKGVYSKRKEFAPIGSNFFPFKVDPFQKGLGAQEW